MKEHSTPRQASLVLAVIRWCRNMCQRKFSWGDNIGMYNLDIHSSLVGGWNIAGVGRKLCQQWVTWWEVRLAENWVCAELWATQKSLCGADMICCLWTQPFSLRHSSVCTMTGPRADFFCFPKENYLLLLVFLQQDINKLLDKADRVCFVPIFLRALVHKALSSSLYQSAAMADVKQS